jgi:dihydrofolate reductase
MKRIVVSEFVTVDGVMEDPGGAEGFPRGGWAFKFERGPAGDKFKLEELEAADTLLLGRVTYEGFAAAWPGRSGDFADKMNNMRKVVVSKSLKEPAWNNTQVISSDVAAELAKLRNGQGGGDILVAGSAQLVTELLKDGLVDELRLMVFPIILGDGKRLFNSLPDSASWRLVESQPVGGGVTTMVYQPVKAS